MWVALLIRHQLPSHLYFYHVLVECLVDVQAFEVHSCRQQVYKEETQYGSIYLYEGADGDITKIYANCKSDQHKDENYLWRFQDLSVF